MATFVTVTRKDTLAQQLINLDMVEMIDVVKAEAPPPLDSNVPITGSHLESAVLYFSGGRAPIAIIEGSEDLKGMLSLDVSEKAAQAKKDAYNKKIAELVAKRAKERLDAQKATIEAEHEAAQAELKARTPAPAAHGHDNKK